MIHTWIPGHPRTKGSLDARMQDTELSKKWRQMMAYALERAREQEHHAAGTAVAVRAVFFLSTGDPTTTNCGDLDKLARNALDAAQPSADHPHLGSRVMADDVQVVRLFVDKVSDRGNPGVLISIWAPAPEELLEWEIQARRARADAMRAQGLLS